jgi:hypothetical protein
VLHQQGSQSIRVDFLAAGPHPDGALVDPIALSGIDQLFEDLLGSVINLGIVDGLPIPSTEASQILSLTVFTGFSL